MAGHGSDKDSKKRKANDKTSANNPSNSNQQKLEKRQQSVQVNVDELAREKVKEVEDSLDGLLPCNSFDLLNHHFSVLKQIITAADLHRTNDKNRDTVKDQATQSEDAGESIYADFTDDNEQFNAHVDLTEQFATNSVKWTIRVQAFKLVHRLIQMIVDDPSGTTRPRSAALKLLPDLVRLSFVAATSPYDELKLQGFDMIRYLVDKFAHVEEQEFAGHSILEQYRTQVLSALKPAFNTDAPPYITAIASQICSLWLCKGLEKEQSDVKRVHQLMSLSIEKLDSQSVNQNSKLYTESELEQERVDILSSWAQLYLASREPEIDTVSRVFNLSKIESDSLYALISSQINIMTDKWWEVLKDYALLIMPAPRLVGTSSQDNGGVYTREVALRLFEPNWPKLVLAATIWLCGETQSKQVLLNSNSKTNCDTTNHSPMSQRIVCKEKYARFIFGIIMKELCRRQLSKDSTSAPSAFIYAVRALNLLLTHDQHKVVIIDDMQIFREFYASLYTITVSFCRDQHRHLFQKVLERMFSLGLEKVQSRTQFLQYGLMRLINQIMNAVRDTEIALKQLKNTIDLHESRMHFMIRLQNLTSIIKISSPKILCEPQLLEAIILVFQELLQFELESSFILSAIDQINELYAIIPIEKKSYFFGCISRDLGTRASASFKTLYTNSPSENDKQLISLWDAYVKSFKTAIVLSDKDDRNALVDRYVLTLIENIDINEDLTDLDKSKRKRDLLGASVAMIKVLMKATGIDDLSQVMSQDVIDKYKALLKFQEETKSKVELLVAQRKPQPQQKSSKGSVLGNKPPAAKITLKADFSNFYAKKN